MHTFLRRHGVFLPVKDRKSYAKIFTDLLNEDERHQWSHLEIQEALEAFGNDGFNSNRINYRLKHGVRSAPTSNLIQAPALPPPSAQLPIQLPTPTSTSALNSAPVVAPSLAQNPSETAHPRTGWGKEISNAVKMYTNDDQKYDGINGTLNYKITIFKDICGRSDVPPAAYHKALPTMLTGLALDQYYSASLATKASFDAACTHLRGFFEGPGAERLATAEWNSVSLEKVIINSKDKSVSTCLRILINKLSKLQHGLAPEFQTPAFMSNKLVTACEGIPACQIAVSDPPRELGPLISKLQSSITSHEKLHPN
jgi:hypothetical protein